MRQAIIFDQAIFLVVPKVANTSIKVALAEWSGKHYDVGPRGPLVHGQDLFTYDVVTNLHQYSQPKFGFVRDPWSRLVSCYKNKFEGNGHITLKQWGMDKSFTFPQFVDAIDKHWGNFNSHWAPCSEWFDYADAVIPIEELGVTWSNLQNKFGLPPLKQFNKTGATESWKSYYTEELFEKVRHMYINDVTCFYGNWNYEN